MTMFRLPKTPPKDMFSEFPAEHADLWPKGKPPKPSPDAFSEFAPEDEDQDRWLAVARSQQPAPPKISVYRPPLAVAAVVLSLFTPAAIISTLVVDRQLVAARENLLTASPALPVSLLDASIARLPKPARPIEIRPPAGLPAESKLAPPAVESKPPAARAPSAPAVQKLPPTRTPPSPSGVLPLTSAVLSSTLPTSPPPVSAGSSGAAPVLVPPPGPATPPPAPATPPPAPAGLPALRVAPSASSSATLPPPPESVPPSAAVRNALDRYRRAFNELDSGEVKAIWPDVDEKALARAFGQLSRQLFVFDTCNVDVKGVLATASCRGRAQYVPKVGNKSPRVELREWTFLLRRGPDDWWIQRVDSK
jgi:hypothetical protein